MKRITMRRVSDRDLAEAVQSAMEVVWSCILSKLIFYAVECKQPTMNTICNTTNNGTEVCRIQLVFCSTRHIK